nr:hypothetical protein [Corallococcus sicarius]
MTVQVGMTGPWVTSPSVTPVISRTGDCASSTTGRHSRAMLPHESWITVVMALMPSLSATSERKPFCPTIAAVCPLTKTSFVSAPNRPEKTTGDVGKYAPGSGSRRVSAGGIESASNTDARALAPSAPCTVTFRVLLACRGTATVKVRRSASGTAASMSTPLSRTCAVVPSPDRSTIRMPSVSALFGAKVASAGGALPTCATTFVITHGRFVSAATDVRTWPPPVADTARRLGASSTTRRTARGVPGASVSTVAPSRVTSADCTAFWPLPSPFWTTSRACSPTAPGICALPSAPPATTRVPPRHEAFVVTGSTGAQAWTSPGASAAREGDVSTGFGEASWTCGCLPHPTTTVSARAPQSHVLRIPPFIGTPLRTARTSFQRTAALDGASR